MGLEEVQTPEAQYTVSLSVTNLNFKSLYMLKVGYTINFLHWTDFYQRNRAKKQYCGHYLTYEKTTTTLLKIAVKYQGFLYELFKIYLHVCYWPAGSCI